MYFGWGICKLKCSLYNNHSKRFTGMVVWLGFMVFNATFNNIAVILWQSVLLVEETGVPRENHQLVTSHRHIMLYLVLMFLCFYKKKTTHICSKIQGSTINTIVVNEASQVFSIKHRHYKQISRRKKKRKNIFLQLP